MSKQVVLVVESPRVAEQARKSLEAVLGRELRAMATCGHLYDMPATAENDGERRIDWQPVDEQRVAGLRDALRQADLVIVGTDPDDEGERIAFQVRALAIGRAAMVRLRTSAWTPAAVEHALNSSQHGFDVTQARYSEARRVADRIIGWRYGRPGRVVGGMIAGWLREPPAKEWPSPEVAPPPDCGDALDGAARLSMAIREGYSLLCEAWAQGLVTYPRTDGQQVEPEHQRLGAALARSEGWVPAPEGPLEGEEGSHGALLPVQRDPRKDNAMVAVVRRLAGAAMAREAPEMPGTGEDKPMDARWLAVARRDGLGRPSSWAGHMGTLEAMGLLEDEPDAGRMERLIAKLPEPVRDPVRQRAFIEQLRGVAADKKRLGEALAEIGVDAEVDMRWSWREALQMDRTTREKGRSVSGVAQSFSMTG